ncbi:hypothetical protein F5Y04DRAFT_242845 [Hypomontagnella monticulosa]|nr:hypothetical protein F5Y04DRAFT_242845 [Hypomontagnella monticulosa]
MDQEAIYNDPAKALSDPRVEAIFCSTYKRWQMALDLAKTSPLGEIPPLESLLVRIPALPAHIPSNLEAIVGESTWVNKSVSSSCKLRERRDPFETLRLRLPRHTKCSLSTEASFQTWKTSTYNGLAPLVLAWAYILNMSLVERQNLSLRYFRLQQRPDSSLRASSSPPKIIRLDYATEQEVAWWKLITTPGKSCLDKKRGKRDLPWTLSLEDICYLEIDGRQAYSNPNLLSGLTELPSANTAAAYLARFCAAYDLGDQISAAFAAALCLPSRASAPSRLREITLPVASLPPTVNLPESYATYPPHFGSLSHFMTLSLSCNIFTACLESVIWAPDITCNVAGAALHAANKILGPILASKGFELLAKVLSSTKAAPLWLGTALCNWKYPLRICLESGDCFWWKRAETAAWTGITQSFFDLESREPYLREDLTISRAHVWCLRRDCCDEYMYPDGEAYRHLPDHPWPPFGFMHSKDVEVELQSHLRCSHRWKYKFWTWLLPTYFTDAGYTTDSNEPELPMPLPLIDTTIDNKVTINKEDMKQIRRLSRFISERIFLWCADQVEKGFTLRIVPEAIRDSEPPEEGSDGVTADFEAISKWRDEIAFGDESDSEDELCRYWP